MTNEVFDAQLRMRFARHLKLAHDALRYKWPGAERHYGICEGTVCAMYDRPTIDAPRYLRRLRHSQHIAQIR